jgi:hypothetical protein
LAALEDGNVRGALAAALEAFRSTFAFHGGDHPDVVNDYLILCEVRAGTAWAWALGLVTRARTQPRGSPQ